MKKEKRIYGDIIAFDSGILISDLQKSLNERIKLGFTHLNVSYDAGYEEVDFTPYYERFETDAEYVQRLSREADFKKIVEFDELKELKRLKEKYDL